MCVCFFPNTLRYLRCLSSSFSLICSCTQLSVYVSVRRPLNLRLTFRTFSNSCRTTVEPSLSSIIRRDASSQTALLKLTATWNGFECNSRVSGRFKPSDGTVKRYRPTGSTIWLHERIAQRMHQHDAMIQPCFETQIETEQCLVNTGTKHRDWGIETRVLILLISIETLRLELRPSLVLHKFPPDFGASFVYSTN